MGAATMGEKPKKRPIVVRRLSDQVEQELFSMLQSGDYLPGDRLPSERDLMELFNVGRSSIREALFSLQRKGILQINRGDRPKVIEPEPQKVIGELSDVVGMVLSKPDGVLHFNQVRSFFEASVARYAAENATAEEVERIESALQANKSTVDDFDDFRETDIAFHRTIAEASHNPIVFGVYDALVEWVISKRALPSDLLARNKASVAAHEQIFESIRSNNSIAAYDAMATHIARAKSEYNLLS